MITEVPPLTPVTIPDEDPTIATPVAPLVHVPPVGVPDNDDELLPAHIIEVPVREGDALTVTVTPTGVPHPVVKLIIVVPADTPVTTPVEEPIVATAVLLLVHVPAPARSVKVTGCPIHIADAAPDIADGAAVTVIELVAAPAHPPLPLLAVITLVVVVATVAV